MSTIMIALIGGGIFGAWVAIDQFFRIKSGRNAKFPRKPDGSPADGLGPTLIGVFVLWGLVAAAVIAVPLAIIRAIF